MFEPFGTVVAFDCVSSSDAFVVFGDSQACQHATAKLDGMILGELVLHTSAAPSWTTVLDL